MKSKPKTTFSLSIAYKLKAKNIFFCIITRFTSKINF